MSGQGPLRKFVGQDKGRAKFSVTVPRPEPLPDVDRLLAGAVRVDITPPPGMPKAGYSSNAHDGCGFRSRLRAHVLHLRCGTSSIALVQCDLLGGSSVVQHLVADAIRERTDIPLAGLMMGATHTHAGPGQFSGTDFYNRFASNRGGFDPAWTQFLVDRIAGAVIEAHDTRQPARLAFGSTEVWGSTRNRSLDPHVQNDTVLDKRLDPQRKFANINPELQLLRVDSDPETGTGSAPIGTAVIFSVHGTGISQHAHEYNADVWAYLVASLRHRIEDATGTAPVVGAMEGTHADVAPALRPGQAGHREARRIGRGIGAAAAELHERLGAELTDQVALDVGLREVDLDRDREIDGIELPDRPAVGAALTAGAKENLTPVLHLLPPFRAGFPKRWGRSGPQGVKWVLGGRFQPLVLPTRTFPRVLAVQSLRIGSAVLVGLPFEITVESGRRIGAAVADAVADRGIDRVVVSSVANEYWGYVATEEEYQLQYYEGGHTIYGPNTQRFLAAHAASLVEATVGGDVAHQAAEERTWNLTTHRYLPEPEAREEVRERRFVGVASFTDPTPEVDGFWEQAWVDVDPASLHWHEPLVRVEASHDDGATWEPARVEGWPADDQWGWVSVRHDGADGPGRHRYRARWYEPVHRRGTRHRFVLLANAGRPEVAGAPFD